MLYVHVCGVLHPSSTLCYDPLICRREDRLPHNIALHALHTQCKVINRKASCSANAGRSASQHLCGRLQAADLHGALLLALGLVPPASELSLCGLLPSCAHTPACKRLRVSTCKHLHQVDLLHLM